LTHLFCFGLGYSAAVLAQRLAAQGWAISGTARSDASVARLNAQGFAGCRFDESEAVTSRLSDATHILLSIPPDGDGDPALRTYGAAISASPSVSWIGYFSTVGVYGDAGGGWVDEDTPAHPGSIRGRRRLDAETSWRAIGLASAKSVMVFRLPGIYGPGRSAIDDIRNGTARRIIKPGQVFNRIHVADIAASVEAAIRAPRGDRVYNVTDDEPAPPQDVVSYAARLLGAPEPPALDFATANLSEMARSFYSESKRVRNTRLRSELGVTVAYPSYREGLAAIAAAAD
jgi:nucleoside-diphosphate-sugar epimerase